MIGKTVLHEETCGHYKKHLGKWEDTPNGGWYDDLVFEEAEEIQNHFRQKEPHWKHYSCAHCSPPPTTITKFLEYMKKNEGKTLHSPREELVKGKKKPLTFTIEKVEEKEAKVKVKFETGTILPIELWRFQLALNILEGKAAIPIGGRLVNPPKDSLEYFLQEEEKEIYERKVGTKTAPHVADLLTLANITDLTLTKSESGRTVQGMRLKSQTIESPPPIYVEGRKQPFIWEMVKDAIIGLNGRARYSEMRSYIRNKFGEVNPNSINAHITMCAVNNPSRIHYPQNQKPRVATGKYDFLYKVDRGVVELYKFEKHGLWEIREDEYGNLIVLQKPSEEIRQTIKQKVIPKQVPPRIKLETVPTVPSKKLIIVPCTEKKIWDDPNYPNINEFEPARKAYIGRYGRACINYAEVQERLGHEFLILSTKYGFLQPDDLIRNYEASEFVISDYELGQQITKLDLDEIAEIEVMASRRYYLKVAYLFRDKDIPISHPLANLRIGESINKLNQLRRELEAQLVTHIRESELVEFAPPVETTIQEKSIHKRRSFHCQMDGEAHPATDSAYECEVCKRIVCIDCFHQMALSGLTICPYCQGRLRMIQ